jgi:protein TonB
VTADDYPSRAYREEREGVVGFRLDYDVSGKPTNCSVTRSSGSPDLDSTACSLLMRRGKFKPGTQNGQPVAGSFSSAFRWQLPKE